MALYKEMVATSRTKVLLRKNAELVFHSHNDLPYEIRDHFKNNLEAFDLNKNSSGGDPAVFGSQWQTDIPRLRAGGVGAQVN